MKLNEISILFWGEASSMFSNGLSLKEFKIYELVQDAIIRNIEIIGEASKKISLETK